MLPYIFNIGDGLIECYEGNVRFLLLIMSENFAEKMKSFFNKGRCYMYVTLLFNIFYDHFITDLVS